MDLSKFCENYTIKVKVTKNLQKFIWQALTRLYDQGLNKKKVASLLDLDYPSFWKVLNRSSIPLEYLLILENKTRIPLLGAVEYLETGSMRKEITLPKKITKDIARIVGAILADGHLKRRSTCWKENKNAEHFELVLRDNYQTNVLAFNKWMKNSFNVKNQIIKKENYYEYYLSNKALFLYLTKELQIPQGKNILLFVLPNISLMQKEKLNSVFFKDSLCLMEE